MIITPKEIADIIIMTLALGFIFKDTFIRRPRTHKYDPLRQYHQASFNWNDFWFACAAIAPAIILHEAAHKFVGISFGLSSTFYAAYPWLALGVALKFMRTGFIFFVPAYVSSYCPQIAATAFCVFDPSLGFLMPTHFASAMVSLAGPLTNCLIWIASTIAIRSNIVASKYLPLVHVTKQVNMFLFFFNMLPIRPFDGGQFFYHIFKLFA